MSEANEKQRPKTLKTKYKSKQIQDQNLNYEVLKPKN